MKKLLLFVALIVMLSTQVATAQPWNQLLSQEKVEKGTLTFYDYQNAFNAYWEPFQIEKGYYMNEAGVKTKAIGWKQFKRWEWYWETRIDKQTGAFPTTSSWEIYQEMMSSESASKSLAGNWTSMGPSQTNGGYAGLGRINCVAFHPTNDNILYTGAAAGGIWKTSNGGTNWIPLGDENAALGVSDIIVIENGTTETIYLATGDKDHSDTYSVGILKSTDGGNTWQTTGLNWTANQQRLIYKLLMDPSNQNLLYAATSNGFYKTIDAGLTWSQLVTNSYVDVEFNTSNSSILYSSNTDGRIYKSTNSGQNWSLVNSVTGGRRTELAVTPNNPNIVYALVANVSNGLKGIYKSTDSGDTFTSVFSSINLLGWDCEGSDTGGQAWYDLCMAADPNNENTLFVGGVNTWKSVNGGVSWDISGHWSSSCGGIATIVHADKHSLDYRHNTSILFEGNDGGIYKTIDNGNSWSHIGNTLEISQMYRISTAQTTTADVIAGLQDNGTKTRKSSGWFDVIGGDGMECIIDYNDDRVQYGSLYYGDVYRTRNKWSSSDYISSGITGNGAWVTPYTLDPNISDIIYMGYNEVWQSVNQGDSWIQISNFGGDDLQSLVVAPSNTATIYAATYNVLYKTTNGGTNWIDITGTLPTGSASINYISVKNNDAATLWISMSGFNALGVFESTNGGSTWTNISSGLPEIPVNCVIENKQNTTDVELYAATDVGVYLKLGTANWIPFFAGLPNVVVTELDIHYDVNPVNSLLRAGTFGRGLWESDLYSTSTPAPVADFIADNTTVSIDDVVTFTDLSSGVIDSWSWNFGDGVLSTDQNPTHTYTAAGLYTVSLIVSGANGSDTEIKADYITVNALAPISDFEATPLSGNAPLLVNFTSLSTGEIDSYFWEFGDGGNSLEQNAVYQYLTPGNYTVSLTVTGVGGVDTESKTDYIEVLAIDPPVVDFSANPTSGASPLLVTFTNLTTGDVDQYNWEFGDGDMSEDENPVHTYLTVGNYSVSLKATGPGGSDEELKIDYILIPVGIDNQAESAYIVYPNPVSQTLQIVFPDKQQRNLTLTDASGNQVLEMTSTQDKDQLDMSKLSTGIYWLTITEKGSVKATVKVVRN